MIKISEYLRCDNIVADLDASTKEEAIRVLLDTIYAHLPPGAGRVDKEEALAAVLTREQRQPTGIGDGMAFPHARVRGWGEFTIAVGASRPGIDFGSPDGTPARIICLMLSCAEEPYMILQSMAAILQTVRGDIANGALLRSEEALTAVLQKIDKSTLATRDYILARDIARPVAAYVTLDTGIEQATHAMHLHQVDVLPVVDEQMKFRGRISCLDIFQMGLPDFFKQLETASFVRHIDPFEKYFYIKHDMRVRDLYVEDPRPLRKDSTLLEIIFEMTVRNRSTLYVVDKAGALCGIVDRFTIIDKFLFY